ncbi:MAG: hypothetical protein K8I60_10150, partial [Anaerolineae bacterium]|nr:hypothetical protein [Anaerolineae bacterium]
MMPLSHSRRFRWLWIVLLILTFHPVAEVSAATFTVTNALNAGAGSLRQAVADANAAPGADVIVFDPAGAPYSIPLLSPLLLTDNAGVMIDGWSAGGAGYSGPPLVEINGTGVVGTAGILILSADNTVRGLAINRMAANAHGLVIRGLAAQNNWVYGCYVGTNTAGNAQLQNQQNGISIINGASNNLIGTNSDGVNDAAERNLVSGNRYYGVTLSTASNNRVSGNYIGTDISGTFAICNGCTGLAYGGDGVLLELGSTGNVIGTNGDGVNDAIEGNVISGTSNTNNGVFIRDAGTDNNRVAGNLIGTNAAGMTTISNGGGISITYGASHNVIGTNGDGVSDALERNVISGNTLHGVQVLEDNTTGNRIAGNYIGLDSSGTLPMPNGTDGVQVVAGMLPGGPVNTIIGTDGDGSPGDAAEGNVLSGNGNYGVF